MKNLQEDIKTGNFRRVYLLCGDEAYLKIQYKDKLIKALNPDDDTMNFSKYEGKGIEVREMIDLCETMPFFADYRVILVENSGFFKNKCDELADYIKTLPDYVRMVFVEEEVDKRSYNDRPKEIRARAGMVNLYLPPRSVTLLYHKDKIS